MTDASFQADNQQSHCTLNLGGDWHLGKTPDGATICAAIPADSSDVIVTTNDLGEWDSSLAIAILQIVHWCNEKKIPLNTQAAPSGLQHLINLATDIPAYHHDEEKKPLGFKEKSQKTLDEQWQSFSETLIFIGDCYIAINRWLRGKAKTRRSDILFFFHEAGPSALAIVTLISLSVGMILAYLGSVQLRQLGAQVYVANLVSLGMIREMGALMTAILLAGRTGAAYAAQLGTMQTNEEIDALKVMGISSMEFLVLPRLLALVFVMPLLCIYADIIGIAGGALIASGMDVNFKQYILQTQGAVDWVDMCTGLFKSIVFGILIAIAGCQAGLNCGRSSTAVGVATTNAVVRAIVYLILTDAAFNVLYDKLGI